MIPSFSRRFPTEELVVQLLDDPTRSESDLASGWPCISVCSARQILRCVILCTMLPRSANGLAAARAHTSKRLARRVPAAHVLLRRAKAVSAAEAFDEPPADHERPTNDPAAAHTTPGIWLRATPGIWLRAIPGIWLRGRQLPPVASSQTTETSPPS